MPNEYVLAGVVATGETKDEQDQPVAVEPNAEINGATIDGTIERENVNYTVTYSNKVAAHKITVYKTNETVEAPLKGATFSLYTKAGYEANPRKPLVEGLVSGEDGTLELGILPPGEYRLEETKAPNGYLLPQEPVKIIVRTDGVSYDDGTSNSRDGRGVIGNANDGYTLQVINTSGVELPAAGGSGTAMLYALGTALVAVGAFVLLRGKMRMT